MITVHNLQDQSFAINSALIERVDGGPETHVLLSNGTSYVVMESIEEIVRLHREDRAMVQVLASRITSGHIDEPGEASTRPLGEGSGALGGREHPLRLVAVPSAQPSTPPLGDPDRSAP